MFLGRGVGGKKEAKRSIKNIDFLLQVSKKEVPLHRCSKNSTLFRE